MPLTLIDIMSSLVSVEVMLWHVLAEMCHQAHLCIRMEAGNNLTTNYSYTHLTDLLTNWASCQLTSLLNTHTLKWKWECLQDQLP